jgi:hypothetical protein
MNLFRRELLSGMGHTTTCLDVVLRLYCWMGGWRTGLGVATMLTGVAFFRVYWFLPAGNVLLCFSSNSDLLLRILTGWGEDQSRVTVTIAICTSLFLIVIASSVVGTALPLILHACSIDPAHAGPAVQVLRVMPHANTRPLIKCLRFIGGYGYWWCIDHLPCMSIPTYVVIAVHHLTLNLF